MRSDKREELMNLRQEIATIFASRAEPRSKLKRFLTLDGTGRRGVTDLRRRQEQVKERLAALGNKRPVELEQLRRCKRDGRVVRMIDHYERCRRRAVATGDDKIAVQVGQWYHEHVAPLYQSKRAEVEFGHGGEEHISWPYSKSYGHPARWRNGGARVDYRGSGALVVLENYRGTVVAEIPIPRGDLFWEGLSGSDLYAVRHPGYGVEMLERFTWIKDVGLHRTGWAVLGKDGYWHLSPTQEEALACTGYRWRLLEECC